ncbi:SIR2 family protein [Burkholderia sp. R-70006]|uniref:SIR2 family protein n=1 Tax=Paraburkholderia domus TaxID=2793075 RepID=UPI0019147D36|nr:SIR2 family protein [Paraburkholderia domus]MBK5047276.1 SIR2 family protein [Burkholderia sp. R-70006]
MRTAFEYLVERIVSRRCVPLVGAGISMGAGRLGAPWDGHHVKVMIEKVLALTLTARMARVLGEPPNVRGVPVCPKCRLSFREYGLESAPHCTGMCWTCDLREASEARALTKACEAFLWEYGGPNEESTYAELVQTLDIHEFAELDPTAAHFYLAFLAREGLITEVVTTNYDCNLERAYEATWPTQAPVSASTACAIFDLTSFATNAARSSHWTPGADTAHPLKVYKINGCAAQLKREPGHAVDILLTASQLQDWRARRWAADFFRTKVRTACIVTVGFGSDEPQVVHTLQQVLEEFSGIRPKGRPALAASVFDAANAPVVTTYEHYPSFPQLQLVNGFSAWWSGAAANGAELVIGPYQRAVKPLDAESEAARPPGLTADELWADVFQAVFTRLLVRQLRDAAVTSNAAFTSVVPYANQHLSLLAEQLELNSREQLALAHKRSHWIAELENVAGASIAARPQLTRSVAHMLRRGSLPLVYSALSDHGSLFAELAFLLSVLEPALRNRADVMADGLGIWQRLIFRGNGVIEIIVSPPDEGGYPWNTSVFVSCSRTCQAGRPLETNDDITGARRLEIVVGGTRSRFNDLDRRCYALGHDGQTPVAVIRLDWAAIFPMDLPVRSYGDLRMRLMDAIRFPTKYRRRLDSSIRSNRFLQPEAGGK